MAFLPISKEDMKERGIEQLDFVFELDCKSLEKGTE